MLDWPRKPGDAPHDPPALSLSLAVPLPVSVPVPAAVPIGVPRHAPVASGISVTPPVAAPVAGFLPPPLAALPAALPAPTLARPAIPLRVTLVAPLGVSCGVSDGAICRWLSNSFCVCHRPSLEIFHGDVVTGCGIRFPRCFRDPIGRSGLRVALTLPVQAFAVAAMFRRGVPILAVVPRALGGVLAVPAVRAVALPLR